MVLQSPSARDARPSQAGVSAGWRVSAQGQPEGAPVPSLAGVQAAYPLRGPFSAVPLP